MMPTWRLRTMAGSAITNVDMFRAASNAPRLVVARAHQRYEPQLSDRAWAEAVVSLTLSRLARGNATHHRRETLRRLAQKKLTPGSLDPRWCSGWCSRWCKAAPETDSRRGGADRCVFKELAPEAGLEPTTLRLTAARLVV